MTLDIFLYRERPTGQRPGKPTVSRLWIYSAGRDNALAGKERQQGRAPVMAMEATAVVE